MTRLPPASEASPDVPRVTPRSPPAPHPSRSGATARSGHVPCSVVLVLLPPSETKHPGGDGALLGLTAPGPPELPPVREQLVDGVVSLSADVPAARAALGLSPAQDGEIARNAALRRTPTMPAIERYTGVLYDALDVRSLTRAQRRRADERLAVGSALFGVLRARDAVPAYRLSAGSSLPGLPTLRSLWKPVLTDVLGGTGELVVDLRSGAYAELAPVPGAVTVQVLSERPDGSRAVVSHFNKAHKGRLARLLATTTAEPDSVVRLRALLRRNGLHVEHSADGKQSGTQ